MRLIKRLRRSREKRARVAKRHRALMRRKYPSQIRTIRSYGLENLHELRPSSLLVMDPPRKPACWRVEDLRE